MKHNKLKEEAKKRGEDPDKIVLTIEGVEMKTKLPKRWKPSANLSTNLYTKRLVAKETGMKQVNQWKKATSQDTAETRTMRKPLNSWKPRDTERPSTPMSWVKKDWTW